jgi:ABC-type transporter MlaC component
VAALATAVVLIIAALNIIAAPHGAPLASAPTSSEEFVRDTIERAFTIIDDRSLDEEQRRRELREFLRSVADVRRIASFTVGSSARLATEAEINQFVQVLEDYLVARGRDALVKFRNNAIKVTSSTVRARDDVIVNAEVAPGSSVYGRIRIGFRLRKDRDDNDAIVDFQAEGISLAMMARLAFASYLQAHEEKLPLLSEELVRRTARIAAGETAAAILAE